MDNKHRLDAPDPQYALNAQETLGVQQPESSLKQRCQQWLASAKKFQSKSFVIGAVCLLGGLQLVDTLESRTHGPSGMWLIEVQRGDLPLFIASIGRLTEQTRKYWNSTLEQQ